MKLKRFLAVILSVMMLLSMTSFTVSAQDAEPMAESILEVATAINDGELMQDEAGGEVVISEATLDADSYYDEIYLQNVYYKLMNEKNLTIGYLGGSVTVGSGAENPGANSTTAWRALTTQWFEDNFADSIITEVYAGMGGTGSRFASYRMTRDLDLANNTIDLLFIDCCVNDQYEGFTYADKEDLWDNDAVMVAKILENNPHCEIVFINVPNNGTIRSDADSGAVQAHREFAESNGFAFVDFKVAMARALTGNPEATYTEDISNWSNYYADSVHPSAAGYKVYFDYLNEVLLNDLVNEELNVSADKYEDTVPAVLDLTSVDTDRYIGGNANSNAAAGLATIKNYLDGQNNGFMGGNSMSAAAEGYSFTFKFTGKNALIWSNKHVENALLDVYVNDNTNIGSPDNTIDMWRNQKASSDAQNYLFPILAEDLDEAEETTVTIVLRKNVDTATRTEQLGYDAYDVGDALRNQIRNIAIKGGTMDSVEFLEAPDAFKITVEYEDIVVPNNFFSKRIDISQAISFTSATPYMWIDGETEIDTLKITRNGENTGNFATDGYGLQTYGIVLDHYNYVTYYLYVDDPEGKTAGKKMLCNVYQLSGGATYIEAEYEIVPNAWQRIPISLANAQANAQPLEVLKQFHFRPLGSGTTVESMDGVTLYLEKAVFSAEDPGYWVGLNAKITNIKADGVSIDGFDTSVNEYSISVPYGTTKAPVITAEVSVDNATVEIKQAESIDDIATVTLKGASEADDVVYTISFDVFDGIILSGIKAGDTDIELEDGVTKYKVTLPEGTTQVPQVTAIFQGDPSKIVIKQAEDLSDTATVTVTDGDAVTEYTITFYVMPSLEVRYAGAKIVYVSETGAGEKNGTSMDNAYATLKTALNAEASTEGKVVFAVLDDVTIISNGDMNIGKDIVITSAGGDIYATSHPTFKINGGSDIVIENINIYHTRPSGNINGEIYLVAKGNDLTLRNVNAIPYGEINGTVRTAELYVQPGGDGGSFTKTENTQLVLENVTGVLVRGGGYGGSTFAGGLDYTIGGASKMVTFVPGVQAASASAQKTGDAAFDADGNPVTNQPEDRRTVNGDINVTIEDEADIKTIYATHYGIIKGDLIITVKDDATVGKINLTSNSTTKPNQAGTESVVMAAGRLEGNGVLYLLGGSVDNVNGTIGQHRVIIVDSDKADIPETVSGIDHIVTYSGNGTVTYDDANNIILHTSMPSATVNGITHNVTVAPAPYGAYKYEYILPLMDEVTEVSFDNGGTVYFKVNEDDEEYYFISSGALGNMVEAPSTAPVKDGYTFLGWVPCGSSDGNIVTDFGTYKADPSYYYAKFAVSYTVEYNANGGSGAPASQTKEHGVSITLSSTVPTKTGYTFLGWAESSTAASPSYSSGDTYSKNASTVLYAVWKPNTYTITYDANGGTGAPASQTKEHGVSIKLSSTVPTRDGYTFAGWSLVKDDYVVYLAGGTYTSNYSATLYAVWNVATYTVSYNANGGSGAPTAQIKTNNVNLTLSSTQPTRSGYTFLGWSQSSTATTPTYYAGGSFTTNANTVLYAVWKPNTYTVSYDANGGSGAPASQTKTHGVSLKLSSTVPTKDGYTFSGWASSKTGYVMYLAGGTYSSNASVTLYAVWKVATYTVSYDANGGKDAPTAQIKSHGTAITLSSTQPTRSGYTFLGWSQSSSATTPTYYGGDAFSLNADTTLYAVWSPNTYRVCYDANGGSGAPATQTKTHNVSLSLSSTAPTRDGYIFSGWSTVKNGTVIYTAGDTYTSNTSVTLYAVWTEVESYTIEYDANGGEDAPEMQTQEKGKSINLTTAVPTRSGYTFKGWATTEDGAAEYQPGALYDGNEDLLLFAVWEKIIDPDAPQLTVDSTRAIIGGKAEVNVKLVNNPGIWGLNAIVSFDSSVLTLTSVVNGTVFAADEYVEGNLGNSTYILSYECSDLENTYISDTLATLVFDVAQDAELGAYPISITYTVGDIINIDEETIDFEIVNGEVEIIDVIYGDVNGDYAVNKLDSLRLKKFLAGQSVQINEAGADVNADGSINKLDSLRLKKYLAGLDVVLGK